MQTIRPNADTTQRVSGVVYQQAKNSSGAFEVLTHTPSQPGRPQPRGQTTMFGNCDSTHNSHLSTEYVECSPRTFGDVFVMELASPSPTPPSDYNHIIGFGCAKNSSGGQRVDFVCELRQGYTNETPPSDSTADLDEALDNTETVVTVTDGSVFAAGDVIQVESEMMVITSVSVNDLTVTRGAGGTAAAEHVTALSIFDINQGMLVAVMEATDVSDVVTYYSHRLTTTEASYITDYTDLQFRFTAKCIRNGGAAREPRLFQCQLELPSVEGPGHLLLTTAESALLKRGMPLGVTNR